MPLSMTGLGGGAGSLFRAGAGLVDLIFTTIIIFKGGYRNPNIWFNRRCKL